MFCPQCGSEQSDELKFCKACGANLLAVRKAVESPDAAGKFDWNKTWLAEMLLSGEEAVKRKAEIERLQGITADTKRRNEIKAGVITTSVGFGSMFVLFVLMNGIILSGNVSNAAAEILARVWVAGLIPVMVGLALIFNGLFVSKGSKPENIHRTDTGPKEAAAPKEASFLPPKAETSQLERDAFSVTDETTRHLAGKQR
jgi:hypothetical protein